MDYANKARRRGDKIIAIDGPAGSGKSTVAKEVARRLDFLYVDTGAIYRALTLAAMREKVDLEDGKALAELARRVKIQLSMRGDSLKVMLGREDVSRAIREQALTERVRFVAQIKAVRAELVKLQRKLAENAKGAVLEGRDIGTVVFPTAKYKFYLDASPSERTRRRFKELRQMGQKVRAEAIAEDIEKRDKSDMTRAVAPLAKAQDAVFIDTTKLSVRDVVEKILDIIGASSQ
ncbi:MAG: (d)CMP kinase [Candidatus Omnitrophota bacterium]|nr:MAG: (d)CMP kinase [Candidatus Omnitrophota bacterium]